jgi:cell division protein FtsI/penicillin-binding protein 2
MTGRSGRSGLRNALLIGTAVVLVATLVGGLLWVRHRNAERERDAAARSVAQQVASGLASGDLSKISWDADTQAVQEQFRSAVAGLGEVHPKVDVTAVARDPQDGSKGSAALAVAWPFGWSYETSVGLAEKSGGQGWHALWKPDVIAPDLVQGDILRASRTPAKRADILGPGGTVLVSERPVVDVGVQPSRAADVHGLSVKLGQLLNVDAAALEKRIKAAKPDAFVDVITLRQADYDGLKAQLQPLPGTVFRQSTLPLAPTREFARALLGTVGPVTQEIVQQSGGRLAAGDVAGVSGVQKQYDEQLGGKPGLTVTRTRGSERTELFTVEPVAGKPVQLTIDPKVQEAADSALATAQGGNGNAAMVAVSVKTGEVLAVANTPASGANRAMVGQYAPGSTFKTISTQALLAAGVKPTDTVPCPPTATVEGRSFRNFEGGSFGAAPFSKDFAQSCNTAFVGLSSKLSPDALTKAAAGMGIGVDWSVGVPAYTGSVPAAESDVDKAAAVIGQGKNLVSPLGMALSTATIARGEWKAPTLVVDPKVEPGAAPSQPAADLATIRELMRGVVTSGTASALADVPGQPVYAKTGTAEFGSGSPPPTHAWAVGFQGDIAFAVLVEEGSSGGAVAIPVAEAFLRALGSS